MKLRSLLLFTFFIWNFTCIFGQQTTLDEQQVEELWELVFSDPDKAIKEGKKYITAAQQLKKRALVGKLSSRIGVAYDLKGEPEHALDYFLKAIDIQKQLKDSVELSFSYNNLGLMYYAQYDYTPALKYLRQSLAIDRGSGNTEAMAGSLVNIGIVLTYIDSMDQSIELYNEALNLYAALGDSAGIMNCYSNMGKVYYHQQDYRSALQNYRMVEHYYARKEGTEEAHSASYNSLANTYLKMGATEKALEYAFRDLETCLAANLRQRRQFAYETINEIYLATGNYKEAHRYLKKYTDLRDSLLNESRTSILEEMQTRYQIAEKNNELSTLKLEKQEETIRKERYLQYMWIGAIAFVLILLIVSYFLYSKQRINRLLRERNQLNDAIIEQKELLMGEVHHRVKNNLQLISSIIDLQSMYAQNNLPETLNDIRQRVNSIAVLHEFLYQGEQVDKVQIDQYLSSLAERLSASFDAADKTIRVELHIAPLWIDTSSAVPIGLIANELLTNSYKYAFKGRNTGNISIHLRQESDKLILEISDDGTGTEDQISESFGTRLVTSLCRQLKAEWTRESAGGLKHHFIIKRFNVYE